MDSLTLSSPSGYRYKVSVSIDGSRSNVGYFNVALYSASENTRQYQIHRCALYSP